MPVDLALYQPDIPQNTGTLLRLGACLGVRVHVIQPTGFNFSQRTLRRSALDYLADAAVMEHSSYEAFARWRRDARRRLVLLTTKASESAYAVHYAANDILMVGRESAGVPDEVNDRADARLVIPIRAGLRSINVATAAAMALGEALRQTQGFPSAPLPS